MKISIEALNNSWDKVTTFFKGVENLYLKFILTIIAIALLVIASKLPDTNEDYVKVRGSVSIDGSIDTEVSGSIDAEVSGLIDAEVSGSIDTYEQN